MTLERANKDFDGKKCPYCGGTDFTEKVEQIDKKNKIRTLVCETCAKNGYYTFFTYKDDHVWGTCRVKN